jgi:maltooligosyltrehalose trehalohydrolase
LGDGRERPDPVSRYQPDGVDRPSAIFLPNGQRWQDPHWTGIDPADLILYELHIGTFTQEGTFDAARERLAEIAALGITGIEIMPVAQFSGERNWGYDGVHPFAVQNSYGGPAAYQKLVDEAHRHGLAVIQDVVYNHFGPEGNYLSEFGPYLTDRYHTPWGPAVNFDDLDCDPVRRMVTDNARMWIRDFHCDGLRLDAVQMIFDRGPRHILSEIREAVQEEGEKAGRRVHVIAETDENDVVHVLAPKRGGYGQSGMWSDDFHHAMHAYISGENSGYYRDFGRAEEIAEAIDKVFVFDGRYKPSRRRRFGTPTADLPRWHFVTCLQNHDQIGNRPNSDRFPSLVPPPAARLAACLLLLSPHLPLIFMGEEYGESAPFPFFSDFSDPILAKRVRTGRRNELKHMHRLDRLRIANPQRESTFETAKLNWPNPGDETTGQWRALYGDLISLRKQLDLARHWRKLRVRWWKEKSTQSKILEMTYHTDSPVRIEANLHDMPIPPTDRGDDLPVCFCSETSRYGGQRQPGEDHRPLLPWECRVRCYEKEWLNKEVDR